MLSFGRRRKNPRKRVSFLPFVLRRASSSTLDVPEAVTSYSTSVKRDGSISRKTLEVTSVLEFDESAEALDTDEVVSSAPSSSGPSTPNDPFGVAFSLLPGQTNLIPDTGASEVEVVAVSGVIRTEDGPVESLAKPANLTERTLVASTSRPPTPAPSPVALFSDADEAHISVYDRDSAVEDSSSEEGESDTQSTVGQEELTREEVYAIALEGLRDVGHPRDSEQIEAPYSFTLAGDLLEDHITISAIMAQIASGRLYRRAWVFRELYRRACFSGLVVDQPEIRLNGPVERSGERDGDGEEGTGEGDGADEGDDESIVSEGEVEEGESGEEVQREEGTMEDGVMVHLPGEYPEEPSPSEDVSLRDEEAVDSDEESFDDQASKRALQSRRLSSILQRPSGRPQLNRVDAFAGEGQDVRIRFAGETEAGPSAESEGSTDQVPPGRVFILPNHTSSHLPSDPQLHPPPSDLQNRDLFSTQWFFFAKDSLGFEWWFTLDLDCKLHWSFSFLTDSEGAEGNLRSGDRGKWEFLPKEEYRKVESAVRRRWAHEERQLEYTRA